MSIITTHGVASFGSSGAVLEAYTYTPYGAATASSPGGITAYDYTFGFTRHRVEYFIAINKQLAYARHRDYDPDMGRFIQQDPIGHGDGLNVFAYAGNSPIGASDPLGLFGVPLGGSIGDGLTGKIAKELGVSLYSGSSNDAQSMRDSIRWYGKWQKDWQYEQERTLLESMYLFSAFDNWKKPRSWAKLVSEQSVANAGRNLAAGLRFSNKARSSGSDPCPPESCDEVVVSVAQWQLRLAQSRHEQKLFLMGIGLYGTVDYCYFRRLHAPQSYNYGNGVDYYLEFGVEKFEAFRRLRESGVSPELAAFIDLAAVELQVLLDVALRENPAAENSRDSLTRLAVDTHGMAYETAGFKNLAFDDQLRVIWTGDLWDAVTLPGGLSEVVEMAPMLETSWVRTAASTTGWLP